MFQNVTYRPTVYKTGVVGDGGRKVKKAMRCIKGQSKTISQTSSVGESNCVTVKPDRLQYVKESSLQKFVSTGKSPKVTFHGITLLYSYFEII